MHFQIAYFEMRVHFIFELTLTNSFRKAHHEALKLFLRECLILIMKLFLESDRENHVAAYQL